VDSGKSDVEKTPVMNVEKTPFDVEISPFDVEKTPGNRFYRFYRS
jgi:hypothetical protein